MSPSQWAQSAFDQCSAAQGNNEDGQLVIEPIDTMLHNSTNNCSSYISAILLKLLVFSFSGRGGWGGAC